MTTYKEIPADPAAAQSGKLTLAEILELLAAGDDDLPLKFTAYDGSTAGPADAEIGLDLATPARHHLSRDRTRRTGPGTRLRLRRRRAHRRAPR